MEDTPSEFRVHVELGHVRTAHTRGIARILPTYITTTTTDPSRTQDDEWWLTALTAPILHQQDRNIGGFSAGGRDNCTGQKGKSYTPSLGPGVPNFVSSGKVFRQAPKDTGNVRLNITPSRLFTNKQYALHIVVLVCSLSHAVSSAHAPYYIAICGLQAVPYFPHAISKEANHFRGKKNYWT